MKKNNQNRNLIFTIFALVVVVIISGLYMTKTQEETFGFNTTATTADENADTPSEELYIGLLQYAAHPSLDAITQGIIDTLAENDYIDGETITLDFQNGQGDQSNLSTMANRFVANEADLMIGIATPAAMSLSNASTEIPVLLGAITDPENVGLIESNEAPGGNVTGVSDMTPIAQQLDLIRQLQGEAKTLGILYSSSEDNSILQGEMVEELASDYDFETVTRTVSSTNDVAQVTQQLVAEADAIWVPNDNIVASAFPSVLEVTNAAKVPVYPAVDMMVTQGGLATLGLNQYEIGVKTGEMAVEILNGEIEPSSEPIRFAEDTDLVINYEAAELLDITIPEALTKEAIDSTELEEEE